MESLTDKEIFKASDAIEKALSSINKTNRGEVAVRILSVVRNLNDHVADKVWKELRPKQPMGLQKVAEQMVSVSPYQFIAQFDKFLRKSVSHFTPSEEGAERLLIKYYRYILELKKLMYNRYGIEIIKNIDLFLEDIDEQTKDYYTKVAQQIQIIAHLPKPSNFDNYYIDRIKPFYINQEIYFEITLEPATEKPNKFNRITAFTKCDICTNYSVSLNFLDSYINVFGIYFPIKIITEWHVSIRPCEINNFVKIFNTNVNIQRSHGEYKSLMMFLEEEQVSLVDIIDFTNDKYNYAKEVVTSSTKINHSIIFDALDKCRNMSINNLSGKNILRYLLHKMNNRIIKEQWPDVGNKKYCGMFLSSKCMPFDKNPFSFNPKGHIANLYDLLECINTNGREAELLARYIESNTSQNSKLFTPIDDLALFGNPEEIKCYVHKYNSELYEGFKPSDELDIYREHVFNKGHELKIIEIISKLKELIIEGSLLTSHFSEEKINELKSLQGKDCLDDPTKADILCSLFKRSKVHFIYGAAGTGKTTLINHVSNLLSGKRKVFLAKTNPAVENLCRKVINHDDLNEFVTIDSFTKKSWYKSINYDFIVVDECSTVKNEEILKIINMVNDGVIILVGDTYQIEAIGFGNWFSICRNILPDYCCHELVIPHRSANESLKQLWGEVRNMSDNNVVLEQIVRNDYSHKIDDNIFDKKADDEIILCLNYNGLYGLNNINRLLQLSNPNKSVDIGIWCFKKDDPILFNNSERFSSLYNNLKGKIVDLEDFGDYVYFTIEVAIYLTKDIIECCDGLDFIESDTTVTKVGFKVARRPPYSSDEESMGNEHIIPFQIAYAVSIHKSQGLEYDSVKIVIADETEDRISHNIFYTAITRAKNDLTIYWSAEVCNRILARIRPLNYNKDFYLLKSKNNL